MRRKRLFENMKNLYGWSISEFLPTGHFHEIESTQRNQRNKFLNFFLRTPFNNKGVYFIGCDIEYPSKIPKKTNRFPFCSDKKTIEVANFSPGKLVNKPEKYKSSGKLFIGEKITRRFFIHHRRLKFHIGHGIRFINVHTVYRFKQSPC